MLLIENPENYTKVFLIEIGVFYKTFNSKLYKFFVYIKIICLL